MTTVDTTQRAAQASQPEDDFLPRPTGAAIDHRADQQAALNWVETIRNAQPALLRMWEKQRRGYRAMGFRIAESSA